MSIVFMVKFDGSQYYATKQPNYHWTYTTEVQQAKRYKTETAARERGEWGTHLMPNPSEYRPTSYSIEKYDVVETLVRVDN